MKIPTRIDVSAAWYGADLRNKSELWSYHLSSEEISELENAASNFIKSDEPLGKISKKSFHLPKLGSFMEKLQNELREGLGFKLIRGLPVDQYDAATFSTIFCSIGSHLGLARSQNAAGHLLGHVRDIGLDVANPSTRVYQST